MSVQLFRVCVLQQARKKKKFKFVNTRLAKKIFKFVIRLHLTQSNLIYVKCPDMSQYL
jgi:hypothetical protein